MLARLQKKESLLLLFAERMQVVMLYSTSFAFVGCIRNVVELKVNSKRIHMSDMYKLANRHIIGLSRYHRID